MTPCEIEHVPFDKDAVEAWAALESRRTNWPVVYVLDSGEATGARPVAYVGETINAMSRMLQHLSNPKKTGAGLTSVRVVIDERFNKSVCLDLESHLIRWLDGDGKYEILNSNAGITDSDYYRRERYRESFREVFGRLRDEGVFARSIPEIENSDLFKLSPFKALTSDQAIAAEDILDGFFDDLAAGSPSTSVVEGAPGTGKTIIAIFLMKLLVDIRDFDEHDDVDPDTVFADLFTAENRELLRGFRMALVIPQQSLRESVKRVFAKTPKLEQRMVLSPFDVGKSAERFDLLIVDETHRLSRRANQPSGPLNKQFAEITAKLYGYDDLTKTQLDWIDAQSDHQLLLADIAQTVRPADLPAETLREVIADADGRHRRYPLTTQMRIKAGGDYVGFIRDLLRGKVPPGSRPDFGDYDLRYFGNLADMQQAIIAREKDAGLARLVAGYAWKWVSKKNPDAVDIELDGIGLRWNSTAKDWINSPKSIDEVGSIHTVQGYDLNYAGVIIGPEFKYDQDAGRFFIDRDAYFDAKGKENNPTLGITYSDDDLLEYIRNIYGVLLTRGMLGTYIYACDPGMREYLATRL